MLLLPNRRLVHPAADGDFVICRNAPYGQVLVLPTQRLVHPASDDDFAVCANTSYGQVFMLPSCCLMHPTVDDDFVVCPNAPYGQVLVLPSRRLVHPTADEFVLRKDLKKHFSTNSKLLQNCTEKQIMPFKATVNWLFNDIWRYLVIGYFSTVVRIYYVSKMKFNA